MSVGLPLVVIAAAVLTLASVPAGRSPRHLTASQDQQTPTVLDESREPHPRSSRSRLLHRTRRARGTADQHGSVNAFFVNPNVQYQVFGFGRNTGWACGGFLKGALWWFGTESTFRTGPRAPDRLVVTRPDCGITPTFSGRTTTSRSPVGNNAGALVSDLPGGVLPCQSRAFPAPFVIFPLADANGDVAVPALDADTEYSFQPILSTCPVGLARTTQIFRRTRQINYWFDRSGSHSNTTLTARPPTWTTPASYIGDCP